MTHNLFDNAKFGDMFLTTENKQAVFLRFAENAEYEFAILYVEDWGNVQVFRHNGKAIYNDAAHSIISKKEEPVSEELEDAATKSANKATPYTRVDIGNGEVYVYTKHIVIDRFKAGAKWQKKQIDKDVENLINVIRNSCTPNAFGTLEQCIAAAQIEALKLIKED